MKKSILITAIAILASTIMIFAQTPEKMNYQGIARDNAGSPLANQALGIRISILNDDTTEAYVESHSATTNGFGLYNLAIGDGTPVTGTMAGINWTGDPKSIKLEIDPAGGSNYTDLGTSELLSAPYALFAANGGGLVQITEGGNTGYRRSDANPANYGNIGFRAMDLSRSATASTTRGATGINSTAMGYLTTASGERSIAMGTVTTASGEGSTAMGYSTTASGLFSTAMGFGTTASGIASTSMGYQTTVSGHNSTVIGNWATLNGDGSVYITDNSVTAITSLTANNRFFARFNNGYFFYTNSAQTTGVSLLGGGNSWSTISDSTKKENFLKADGRAFLQKIKTMKLGSWNYIGQDPETFRHYGPMAQEFYARFGKDGIGTIGNDTSIATADIDGVMMIAIQALIEENEGLKAEVSASNQLLEVLQSENKNIKKEFETRLSNIEAALIVKMKDGKPELANSGF